jgi:DNA polymerase-3 subunit epsilon/CBS domain-containing protein
MAALDLETTGLDVKKDRVVQAAAIAMLGSQILDAPRIDQVIDPAIPIPESATRIHGIADTDVAGAPRLPDFVETLRQALAGRVVIGHHIAFDLAILRNESDREGIPWVDPPSLDIAMLVGALAPSLPDLGLETVADHLRVTISNRHTAFGDSMAAAEIFARLIPLLRDADIRTLGEARAFAAQRDDLVMQQAQLGWQTAANHAPAQPAEQSFQVDGFIFQRRLRELMSSPAVFAARDTSLRAAAATMIDRRIGALLVGDPAAPPEGIVTERDLLRASTTGASDLDRTAITDIMTTPVECMAGRELLYRGLARMDRIGIRHLCILDDNGVVAGMVSQRDLLHHRARSAAVLDDALVEAENTIDLAAAFGRVPSVAAQLSAEGVDGRDVARTISTEMRALAARATEIALAQLADEGHGPPPSPWCLVLLGSAGRGESLLGADQDNAIIHADDDNDAWFARFGARVCDFLDEAGIPRCKGGVMAANEAWRGTRETWRQRVSTWLLRARPEDLLNVDIFFDLVPVAGELELGFKLHEEAVQEAARHRPFLALLAASVEAYTPRFDLFGRPVAEDGRIDLKRNGLLPLVGFARALALRIGSSARSTPGRIGDVRDAGRIGEHDASTLIETQDFLMDRILRQQIADVNDGVTPSSRVAVKSLSRDERRDLKRRLHSLDGVVREIRSLIAG